MPRAKSRHPVSARRIREYVTAQFGTTRAAADALKLDHNTIWRAMEGLNKRGPSSDLVIALADHSGKPTDYWLGRAE